MRVTMKGKAETTGEPAKWPIEIQMDLDKALLGNCPDSIFYLCQRFAS